MGLYNLLHGIDSFAPFVLAVLRSGADGFPRFRDAGLDGDRMYVLTRAGGSNTEDYLEEITAVRAHPLYLSDEEDDFDCTYRNFYFRYPQEAELGPFDFNDAEKERFLGHVAHAKQSPPKATLREKCGEALARLGTPPPPKETA